MKISFGNAIYNHKPTDADMKWHSGFLDKKKQPISCPVREDTVENYVFAYDNGICVKGYGFTSEKDIFKRTFVCDFDNLTEEQFNKVVELVDKNNPQGLRRIQGRFSSGMKVDLYNHEGIPDWKPSKWKYKVFFPLDEFYGNNGVMCVREEVERAYLDVVQFFNQWSERKRTEEVARLWLKANNQSMFYKHGKNKGLLRNNHPAIVIENPIFKDYILPDPVEVTNPRHQITYSVLPEMKEPFKFLKDEDWEKILGHGMTSRFLATTKANFTDIVNLPYNAKDTWENELSRTEKQLDNKLGEKNGTNKLVEKALNGCIRTQPDEREIPTSKSGMAKKSGMNEWKDLMFDFQLASSTNRAIYTNWEDGYDMEKVRKTLKDTVKFLVRCQAELELGVNGNPTRQSVVDKTIHDLPWYVSKIFGETFIENMNPKSLSGLAKSIANAIEKACVTFKAWRLEQKCVKLMEENPELNGKWRMARKRLGETANFEEYYKTKNELEKAVLEQARSIEFPYVYVRRGLKKEMVEHALNEGRPMSKSEFVSFVMEKTVEHDGCVDEEKVEGWYRDYQSKFNKVQRMELGNEGIYEQMTGYQLKNGKVRKEHKEHKSKYDDLFKGKTKEEIEAWIESSDLHRQTKKRLREKFL